MSNHKKNYRDLEMSILFDLRDKIEHSPYTSKHIQGKAIKVDMFGYTEMAIVNDRLTFIDNYGLHYSLFADASLEDLIDILEK